jgi:hypothetical protein
MPLFKLIVFLDPVVGRDAEFNEWYNHQRVPDALSQDGFLNGQRFTTGPKFMENEAPCGYAAIYEIEAESLEGALATASDGTARFPISDAVDLKTARAYPLTPLGPVFHSRDEALAHATATAKV